MSSKFVVIGHRSVRMVRGAILAAGGQSWRLLPTGQNEGGATGVLLKASL